MPTPAVPKNASWSDIEPLYRALRERPITPDTLRQWLADFSRLDEEVDEAYSLAMIDYTGDTRNAEYETAYRRWATEILPLLHETRVELGRRILPFAPHLPELTLFLKELETDIAIFRSANLPRMAALEEMEATYDKITGGLTAQWNGETKTIPELQPFLLDRDRPTRERAFRLGAEAYIAKRDEIADLFHRMVGIRHALAREAGFRNYRDYIFTAKYRFDYGPGDCIRFHEAVEKAVLPAIERLHATRRQQLGLDVLRPWDLQVQPMLQSRLRPFSTAAEFVAGGQRIFDCVDPELAGFFRQMTAHRLQI